MFHNDDNVILKLTNYACFPSHLCNTIADMESIDFRFIKEEEYLKI